MAVDHRTGRVTVTASRDIAPEAVRSAVERTGYEFAGTAA
ncbi:Heavy metal transport/detoxification protein [Streptomyces sp. CBMAI 2042]|nr:Heavy metal transport/detoxification protein [Streptomyces sp. CBMAI 2042]